jgi:hypothetical protein
LLAEASKYDPDVQALQRMTCVQLRALIREARALSGAPEATPRRRDAPASFAGTAATGKAGAGPAGAAGGSAGAAPVTPRRVPEPPRAPRSPGAGAPDGIERAVPPASMCNQRAMVLRKNRAQEGNVAWFWGCASYPICKQTFQYVVPV